MSDTKILNWRPSFDERSKNFGIDALIPTNIRRDRLWTVGPILDQGREGACVGFGWTAQALSTPVAVKLDQMAADVPRDPNQFALSIYHRAQVLDDQPGEAYTGTSVLAGAKTMVEYGLLKEYRWAFTIDDVINSVIHRGPVVLGIEWHQGMYQAPGGILEVSGPVVGGHCIAAVGYRTAESSSLKEETLILQNSWGTVWGANGLAEIRAKDVAQLLAQGGEACVPFKRSYGRK